MAFDFDGSNDRLEFASAPVSAPPLTMACWANPDSVSAAIMIALSNSSSEGNRYQLGVLSGSVLSSALPGADATKSGAVTGQWQHFASVQASLSSRIAYLDGVAGTESTVTATTTGVNATRIGAILGAWFNGRIAEVGIWSAALTQAEIASLAKGISPKLVRPSSLVFYAPLIRNLADEKGGASITNTGATAGAAHTRVYL